MTLRLALSGFAQPDFSAEQAQWRNRPEWRELDAAYEQEDEAGILALMEAQPELGRVYSPPFHSPLQWAARTGSTNLLARLIRDGALDRERARPVPQHTSAIGEAAEGGWPESLRLLLQAGADPQDSASLRGTPLERAIQQWNPQFLGAPPFSHARRTASHEQRGEAVGLLLAAGANLFAPRNGMNTNSIARYLPLYYRHVADFLLTNAIPERQTNAAGETLVHTAAHAGATNALQVLLDRGLRADATNASGWSPLHAAAASFNVPENPPFEHGDAWALLTTGSELPSPTRSSIARTLLEHGAHHDVFTAAGLGDLAALARLVTESPNCLSLHDARGRTALHWAALANEPDSLEWLKQHGADLGARDADGNTPLHLALLRWPNPAVSKLLFLGAPLEQTNAAGIAALAQAGYSLPAIDALLGAGALVNPPTGEPPLFRALARAAERTTELGWMIPMQPGPAPMPGIASDQSHLKPVARLLGAGAKVDISDSLGRTPIGVACDAGALNLIELLVQHGGRLNRTDANNHPVWFPILKQRPLLTYTPTATWKFHFTSKLPATLQQQLQRVGLMPDAPMARGTPALPFLASLGADLRATNRAGQNALHAIAAQSDFRLRGVMPFFPGSDGRSPGRKPAQNDPEGQRVAFLLETGLALEGRDADGNTPWLIAWLEGNTSFAETLLQAGVDTRATNSAGMNALHLVCIPRTNNPAVPPDVPKVIGPAVPYLVKLGLNPNATNRAGQTPLHLAVAPPNPSFFALDLLDAGADPTLRDASGLTPLDLAEKAHRADILPQLRNPPPPRSPVARPPGFPAQRP